jgi:hypothetical protein
MQSGQSPGHPDYTWDRIGPLRVLPAVADLSTPVTVHEVDGMGPRTTTYYNDSS